MFGTLGFSELIIILVIILIIFGAGRLPQIGEGVGKALKGFKKEVHEAPPPVEPDAQTASAPAPAAPQVAPQAPIEDAKIASPQPDAPKPTAPYTPGPELTPGTTAALMAQAGPQPARVSNKPRVAAQATPAAAASQGPHIPTVEERMAQPPPAPRAAYPPVPPAAKPQPVLKRPSAIVNKDAVVRVQAQQAALKAKAAQPPPSSVPSPQDMQSLGEGIGDALRTFRQAVADVRNTVDPEMRTIRAEMDAAQKEVEQSIEAAKQMPEVQEEPPKNTSSSS
jgi:TatA/E family protein of Tat protein translocase